MIEVINNVPAIAIDFTKPTFRVSVYDFTIPKLGKKSKWPKNRIRFTYGWELRLPATDTRKSMIISEEVGGCLARLTPDKTLVWATPQFNKGFFFATLSWVSKDLYEIIRDAIATTKYMKYLYDEADPTPEEIAIARATIKSKIRHVEGKKISFQARKKILDTIVDEL